MLSLQILEKTDTSILFELPAGKPNPKQPCINKEETRDRVLQQACKGNTCWYYTFNFIRVRIGKLPCEELKQAREIEKLCSKRRKAQTKLEDSLPTSAKTLNTETGLSHLGSIDLKTAQYLITNRIMMQPAFETIEILEGAPSLFPFIEKFAKENSHQNMHDFLLKEKFGKWNELNTEFLSELGSDPVKLYAARKNSIAWNKLTVDKKTPQLDCFAREVSTQVYGLQKSSWKPINGVVSLINELSKNGPLVVFGILGAIAYREEPAKLKQQIAGRDIYAWKSGSKRNEVKFEAHSVLLTGAKTLQNNSYVYFIDPKDPSDPKDKSAQKIYVISFLNLISNIYDVHAVQCNDSPFPFAFHGTFKNITQSASTSHV